MVCDAVTEAEKLNTYSSIGITLSIILIILIFCGVYFLVKVLKNRKKK